MIVSSDAAFLADRPAARGESRPDVYDRIKADHMRLRFLIAQLRQSRDGAPDRHRLFKVLCDALEAYGAATEQTFYAEFLARAEEENKWPVRRAVGVHDTAELLIFELSNMEMAGEAWQADICQLSEYLEDHFRVEADEVFRLARTVLSDEQAARLGDKYEQAWCQWIECFGRVPVAAQPGPAEWSYFLEMAGNTPALRNRPRGRRNPGNSLAKRQPRFQRRAIYGARR